MNVVTMLETPRLLLQPAGIGHLDGLWAAIQRSLPELRRWMSWAQDPTPADTSAFLERAERGNNADGPITLVIQHERETAGVISLIRGNPEERYREMGYWIRSDLAGRGLTTEAGAHLIQHAFRKMNLHRLELHSALANEASIKVAEKLGFDRRGILRESSFVAGWLDVYVYDLLETDEPAWERYL